MPATIAGSHLGPDIHANRPAANAAGQPIGAQYSCTTHGLIYQTDGSTWTTYATLGTAGAYVAGGTDVAVADGGTGASTASAARTNLGVVIGTDVRAQGSGDPTRASLGLDTTDSPQLAAVNLGHASDTTLTRVSAGVVAIEGTNIVKAGAATGSGLTMATARILGRTTASTGAIEELTVGSGLTLSGGTLDTSGAGGGGVTVQDEGTPLATTGTTLNFVGSGVAATGTGATKTITISGGGASDVVNVASGAGSVTIPGIAIPDRVPGSPHASDDEFDTTDTSDPMTGWTTLGSPTTLNMNSDAKSHLHLAHTATGSFQLHGIYKAIPSMPFTMTMKVSDMRWDATYQRTSLVIGEASGTGKWMDFGLMFAGYNSPNFGYGNWASRTSRSSWGGDRLHDIGIWYVQLVVTSSTNVTTLISHNGFVFRPVDSGINPGFTIGNCGIVITGHDNSVAADSYVDWIRFS